MLPLLLANLLLAEGYEVLSFHEVPEVLRLHRDLIIEGAHILMDSDLFVIRDSCQVVLLGVRFLAG